MSLNQSFISDFSEYSRWSQRTKNIIYSLEQMLTTSLHYVKIICKISFKNVIIPENLINKNLYYLHIITIY